MKVDKEQFDALLQKMMQAPPEPKTAVKTQALSSYQGVIFVGCAAVWGIAFWSTANQQTLDISPAALRRCLDALTACGEETTGVK
jgi:hypothetical protein